MWLNVLPPALVTVTRSSAPRERSLRRETGLFFNASPGSPARTNEAASFGRTLFPIADQYEAADDVTPHFHGPYSRADEHEEAGTFGQRFSHRLTPKRLGRQVVFPRGYRRGTRPGQRGRTRTRR